MTRQEVLVAIRNALLVMKQDADYYESQAKEMLTKADEIRIHGKELQKVYNEMSNRNKWVKQQ